MKEIGSEFWNIPLTTIDKKQIFPDNTSYYLSGRVALNAILDDICKNNAVKNAALPSWCCDSMIKPFLLHGIEVLFYSVYLDEQHNLIQEINNVKSDIILIMDYFGFRNCPEFKTSSIVIRDITHSVWNNVNYNDDYIFGSLRKWTGFYTGGFAWSNSSKIHDVPVNADKLEYCLLRKEAMNLKAGYIESSVGDKKFLELFSKAEECLDHNDEMYGTSEYDLSSLAKLDIEYICECRYRNAEYLLKRLGDLSFKVSINDNECPLFVPIFLDNIKRNELRKHLIEKNIYCPVHWEISEYHKLKVETKKIYDTELSIVCDQRYDLSDMKRIADTIENYLR